MRSRWLLRILFALPILLSLSGWVWSAAHIGVFRYVQNYHYATIFLRDSIASVCFGSTGPGANGLDSSVTAISTPQFWPSESGPLSITHFGFSTGRIDFGSDGYMYVIGAPFWFLTLCCSALLFLAWRKTHSKPNPTAAFPIEPHSRDQVPPDRVSRP